MIAKMRTASRFLEVLRSNPLYVPRRLLRLVDYSYGPSPANGWLRFCEVGALLLLAVTVGGCGVRPGDHPVSSSCEWTETGSGSLNLEKSADRGHLRYDALSAEDIAIRWADKYAGPRSGQFRGFPEYGRRRDECMEALFQGVASHHGMDVALVRQYRMSRDTVVDSVVILGFAFLYALAGYRLAGVIRRRFPSDEWRAFLIATVAMSVLASIAGVMLGDLWSVSIENLRMGSGHLSYRIDRIPWRSHWGAAFICGLVVFWLAAAVRSRVAIRDNSLPSFRG